MVDWAAWTSSELATSHVSETAARTDAVVDSESTTCWPTKVRTSSARTPATMRLHPTIRSAWRRRSRATTTAITYSSSVSSTTTSVIPRRALNPFCTASS